jgi:hypothetical protein
LAGLPRTHSTITGSVTAPMIAPNPAQMYQLHEGSPEQSGDLVTIAASFESSAATIAPLTKPSHAVKHPIATFRVVETRSRVPASSPPASGFRSTIFGLPSSVAI